MQYIAIHYMKYSEIHISCEIYIYCLVVGSWDKTDKRYNFSHFAFFLGVVIIHRLKQKEHWQCQKEAALIAAAPLYTNLSKSYAATLSPARLQD